MKGEGFWNINDKISAQRSHKSKNHCKLNWQYALSNRHPRLYVFVRFYIVPSLAREFFQLSRALRVRLNLGHCGLHLSMLTAEMKVVAEFGKAFKIGCFGLKNTCLTY